MKTKFLNRLIAFAAAAAVMLTVSGCKKNPSDTDNSYSSAVNSIAQNSSEDNDMSSSQNSEISSETPASGSSATPVPSKNQPAASSADSSPEENSTAFQVNGSLGSAQKSQPGLYVENGVVKLGGNAFYGIGTNYYDAYIRQLTNPLDGDIEKGIKNIAGYNIPYIRARFSPWGDEGMDYFWNDRETFFRATDRLVSLCEKYHIGIIATLAWTTNAYKTDSESVSHFFQNTNSEGFQKMLVYMKAIVTRYKNSPAIWGWEIGNEYNLGCDVNDSSKLTADVLAKFYKQITPLIRKWDGTNRIISTGNSQNRGSSWHLWKQGNWNLDTLDQQKTMAELWKTPEMSVNSIHVYNTTQALDGNANASVSDYLAAMVSISKQLGTPLFIGEYCDDVIIKEGNINDETSLKYFDIIHDAVMKNDIQLSCLWIYSRVRDDYIRPTDYFKHMLLKAQSGNKTYIAGGKQKTDVYWNNMTAVVK